MPIGSITTGGLKLIPPQPLSIEQLKVFAVGLIDGDGSLQVNQWRRRGLQYRLVVKLADKPGNFHMLNLLATAFGGTVRSLTSEIGTLAWVIDNSYVIRHSIIPLLTEYPPLTTRIRLQLAFVIKALNGMSMTEYFHTINNKYDARVDISPLFTPDCIPTYFAGWLAGFIEAEGSFSYRVAGNYTFSIAQLHDEYLVKAVRDYFGQTHLKVRTRPEKGGTLYEIAIGSLNGVESVITFCLPLLQGFKYVELAEFTLKVKTQLRQRFWTSNSINI